MATATKAEGQPISFKEKAEIYITEFFSSGHVDTRTEATLEREKYTFWAPWSGAFNRWFLVIPVLITQICIGSLYSWSIFNSTMDKVWGTPGANANAFTIAVAMFGIGTATFGNWIERNGPFWACFRTLFLTPAGWAFACLGSYPGVQNMGIVYAGFGLCHGFGAAYAYISTCSAIQKWFPEFKGLATGLAVMGFGVGSFIWTTIGKALMDPTGSYKLVPYQVQGIFAAVYFGALLLALPFLRIPAPHWKPNTEAYLQEQSCRGAIVRMVAQKSKRTPEADRQYTFFQAVSSFEFILTMIWFFGTAITGIVFLSSAADMTQNIFGRDTNYGNFITSMLNLMNFTGRFAWGFISDKIGRKTFYLMSAAAQAFAVGLMAVYIPSTACPTCANGPYPIVQTGSFEGWLTSFLIIGSLYGGGFGILPALMSDMFGPKISGATHGVMVAVWALAAVIGIPVFGSFTAKYYFLNASGKKIPQGIAYIYNSYWLCGLPTLSFFLLLLVNINPHDRRLRAAKRDLRVRIFSYVLRINFAEGVRWLNPAQQDEEYRAWAATQKDAALLLGTASPAGAKTDLELSAAKTGIVAAVPAADPEAAMPASSDDETPTPLAGAGQDVEPL